MPAAGLRCFRASTSGVVVCITFCICCGLCRFCTSHVHVIVSSDADVLVCSCYCACVWYLVVVCACRTCSAAVHTKLELFDGATVLPTPQHPAPPAPPPLLTTLSQQPQSPPPPPPPRRLPWPAPRAAATPTTRMGARRRSYLQLGGKRCKPGVLVWVGEGMALPLAPTCGLCGPRWQQHHGRRRHQRPRRERADSCREGVSLRGRRSSGVEPSSSRCFLLVRASRHPLGPLWPPIPPLPCPEPAQPVATARGHGA